MRPRLRRTLWRIPSAFYEAYDDAWPVMRTGACGGICTICTTCQNHEAAIALHYMHSNFARIHKTLRITPAMASGVTDRVWELEEIIALLGDK